jgi:hypothetical protein
MGYGEELRRAYGLQEGKEAYERSKRTGVKETNPYENDTESYNLWSEGYHAASWQDTMKF